MTGFGEELHRLLAERGISLSAAARGAGCSKGYLSNAANGRKPLTPRVAAGLDRLFGTAGTFAAHALLSPSGGTTVNGAEHGDCAVPGPEGPEKERLVRALAHPASADLVTVAGLREQVRHLDEQYDRSPAAALIADT